MPFSPGRSSWPLQHRSDGSVTPRLLSSGDGAALPGFSSESVLRAALGGITDWVTVKGHEIAESSSMKAHPDATYAEAHAHANDSLNWQS